MRLVSQHGNVDLPYENTVLLHNMEFVVAQFDGKEYVMGKYSSEEKAYKVMGMLRELYMRWECFFVLANGTCEHMENSFSSEEFPKAVAEFCQMNVFQFPKDEEVEDEV